MIIPPLDASLTICILFAIRDATLSAENSMAQIAEQTIMALRPVWLALESSMTGLVAGLPDAHHGPLFYPHSVAQKGPTPSYKLVSAIKREGHVPSLVVTRTDRGAHFGSLMGYPFYWECASILGIKLVDPFLGDCQACINHQQAPTTIK